MKTKLLSLLALILFAGGTMTYALAQNGASKTNSDSTTTTTAKDPESAQAKQMKEAYEEYQKPPLTEEEAVKPVKNACAERNELREEARLLLRPFKYNLAKTTMITFKRYAQKKTVIIPIYSNQNHRLVFSSKGLPQVVGIKVYDRPKEDKKRELLFTSNQEEMINTFELTEDYKGSYLFVEYSIPPTDMETREYTSMGCAILFMGYLNLSDEDMEGTMGETEGETTEQ